MRQECFLVTGCAGFIGRHILRRLLADGHSVRGIDDFSTSDRKTRKELPRNFEFIEGSLCDPEKAAAAISGIDRVIHLASIPSVPRSLENPRESAMSSVIGTVTLLDAAARSGVRRIVQASSSSVYGDSPVLPRIESDSPRPLSPYAAAKLAQEQYASVFAKCRGLDSVSLRYFNVFGPGQNPNGPYAAVVPKFIRLMAGGKRPEIYGDGNQTRDFTHVDDVAAATIGASLVSRPLRGETINIGSGKGRSLNELATCLNEILGTCLEPVYARPRPGDVRNSLADIAKAERLLGYLPSVPFREGLERTVASMFGKKGKSGKFSV
ncbi:MAG: NAD-dependent epimerase/dehydratase family protein [Planctomycetota bacterium]|jgi:UDP-glucose 4-epimerase|nr:NAD-dependent epimerase/dehydratase family protein [Planctomycetota bacterium]